MSPINCKKRNRKVLVGNILLFLATICFVQLFHKTRFENLEEDELLDMISTSNEMKRRKQLVNEVCKRERLGVYSVPYHEPDVQYPPIPNYESFYFERKHKLAYCPIYKAASTSWLYNFCLLAGVPENDLINAKIQISTIARNISPSLEYADGQKAMNHAKIKFFIVRHPFERLLSAYRDKLENKDIGREHGTLHFYKKYGQKIVAKYRDVQNNGTVQKPEPTFEEFVKYLLDLDLATMADDHWLPYYIYCTPCSIDYDIIAKFESLQRDQLYIIKKSNLENKIRPIWKHKSRDQSAYLIQTYFSTLTKKQIIQLYNKYKLDFDMFDYSVNKYIKVAK